ncbi:MAG: hypothetical protein KC729_02260, partial [Candidatus Eisenbacteria bacterium]|nr:hypothetical protein [Candidatus Eisenbacteria bacterium]
MNRKTLGFLMGFAAFLACGTPAVPALSAPGPGSQFTIIAADRGLQIEFRLDEAHTGPESSPIAATSLAVPPGASVHVERTILEEVPADWVESLDPAARRALADAVAGAVPEATPPTRLRNQMVTQLRHPWLRVDAGRFYQITRARFEVAFSGAEVASRPATGSDPFEHLYEGVELNYEQGRRWRLDPVRSTARRGGDYFSSTGAPWVKVLCSAEDLFAISGTDLEGLSIDLGSIDPLTIRMFSPRQLPVDETVSVDDAAQWMDPMAIRLEGMEDGVFDPTDRVVFLGDGPDAWYTSKGLTPPGLEAYARDPYANENVYWLTWGGSFSTDPLRMGSEGAEPAAPFVTRVRDRLHLEEDNFYNPRMRELGVGTADWEIYWWRERTATEERDDISNVTVTMPDPVATEPVSFLARFWGANDPRGNPELPDHDLEFQLNEHFLDRRTWNGHIRNDFTGEGVWLVPGDTQVFKMILHSHPDPSIVRQDQVDLAYIDVEYTHTLRAREDRLAFFAGGFSGVQSFAVSGFGGNDVLVIDATTALRPSVVTAETVPEGGGTTVRFVGGTDPVEGLPARYLLRRASGLPKPRLERDAAPAGGYLRERTDPVQMIIVTHERFRTASERLATYRRTHFPDRAQAQVAVVDVQDVFDEFSFGRKDPIAIRN